MARLLSLPLILIFALPLLLALVFVAPVFFNVAGFASLLEHPQFWGAAQLSVFTGITSTFCSLAFAILIVANSKARLATESGAMLALPHVALAIGLVFLIAPSGVLARFLALPFGWDTPPPWVTVQDPSGMALIAALVLKETPFLVFALASLLARDDLRHSLSGQTRMARSLGHDGLSIWLGVLLPQLLPRMVFPIIAVAAYGMTVVDMALVIGPTQPPTLATIIWRDLNDGEAATNARGAAGVLVLSLSLLFLLLVVGTLLRQGWSRIRGLAVRYPHSQKSRIQFLTQIWGFWRVFYACLGILLLVHSFSGHWPFPDLWPGRLTGSAWVRLLDSPAPLLTSLILGLATSTVALAACVAWFESVSAKADRMMSAAAVLTLCLPALVIALGQYRLFLSLGLTGTAAGLFLAHVLPVAAYVFIMLAGPYRHFDPRWQVVSSGLMQSRWPFLRKIKWPLLKGPLLSAWAVGFAVSLAQFVPAQLAAAGRFTTLPIEAVTLTSGSNRALTAAAALLLMALPLLAFAGAGRLSRSRWVR